jgi:hypothetical protein
VLDILAEPLFEAFDFAHWIGAAAALWQSGKVRGQMMEVNHRGEVRVHVIVLTHPTHHIIPELHIREEATPIHPAPAPPRGDSVYIPV